MKCLLSTALLIVSLSGCAVSHGKYLTFKSPLDVGHSVPANYIVITCNTRDGARYMSRTGFYHPGCQRTKTGEGMRVVFREYEHLGEGGMWLFRIRGADAAAKWLVLPWHDWA